MRPLVGPDGCGPEKEGPRAGFLELDLLRDAEGIVRRTCIRSPWFWRRVAG